MHSRSSSSQSPPQNITITFSVNYGNMDSDRSGQDGEENTPYETNSMCNGGVNSDPSNADFLVLGYTWNRWDEALYLHVWYNKDGDAMYTDEGEDFFRYLDEEVDGPVKSHVYFYSRFDPAMEQYVWVSGTGALMHTD
jgi:hypothetical protein